MGVFNAKAVERIGRYQAARSRERPPEAPFGLRMSNEDTLKMSKAAAQNLMLAARMRGEEALPGIMAEAAAERQEMIETYEKMIKYGKKQAAMSRRPLEKQDTDDAWNERQNRVASGRIAADILLKATMQLNKAKQNETE